MKNAVIVLLGLVSGALVVGAFAAAGAVMALRMLQVIP